MINAATKVYAVFGMPVAHSLSPVMHNRAFEMLKLNCVYLAFEVESGRDAAAGMRALGIKGASVTIPHKVEIMKHLDSTDRVAEKIGAVNTVIAEGGRLRGTNTDSFGVIKALSEKIDVRGKEAAVIGAGGAARAAVYGLVSEKAAVTVVNRTVRRGEELARSFDADFIPLPDFTDYSYDIIINTTALGMHPDVESSPLARGRLHKDTLVMDIVYNPLETKLLKDAKSVGCTIVEGIDMFVFQGAEQFKLFTGKEAPADVMRESVLKVLP